jgi:hypothetical protein
VYPNLTFALVADHQHRLHEDATARHRARRAWRHRHPTTESVPALAARAPTPLVRRPVPAARRRQAA